MLLIPGIIASSKFGAVGDFESIATVSAAAGGSSSLVFTDIPGTYQHLQIRGIGVAVANPGVTFRLRMNSDSGSNYATHYLLGEGASASSGAITSTTSLIAGTAPESVTYYGSMICDILDYANTNKYTTTKSLAGGDMNGATGYAALYSGLWMNTNAVTSITLFPGTGSWKQYTTFALYGIKG